MAETDALLADLLARLRGSPVDDAPELPAAPLAGRGALPPDAVLVDVFRAAASRAGCWVTTATAGDWVERTVALLRDADVRRVVVAPDERTALAAAQGALLTKACAAAGIEVTLATDDATLFDVPAAVTGVLAGVAETGTLVCASGPGAARGVSLIPPTHIAVVAAEQLVADLADAFALLEGQVLPSNVNLITGPSKTADIEGVLISGVHGPGVVQVVLVAGVPGAPACGAERNRGQAQGPT